MPELPEVETIKRQLELIVAGKHIACVSILDPLLTAPAPSSKLARALEGSKISGMSRRGKYLRFELADGGTFIIHLRMTGILTCIRPPLTAADKKYLRLTVELDDGTIISFQDSRRFGKAWILPEEEAEDYWQKLGPEPLERSFNHKALAAILYKRKRPVKPTIMDQQLVAGIGNIYSDEALFRARIHPERPAGSISGKEIDALTKSIKETLRRAIRLQGSSIDSYRDALGNQGRFQETFDVHRRAGELCPSCGTAIEKIQVGGGGLIIAPAVKNK